MNKFLEQLAEIFEVETNTINMNTVFRDEITDWCSLMGFSILVLLEDDYNVNLTVEEFLKCLTIEDLYKKIE